MHRAAVYAPGALLVGITPFVAASAAAPVHAAALALFALARERLVYYTQDAPTLAAAADAVRTAAERTAAMWRVPAAACLLLCAFAAALHWSLAYVAAIAFYVSVPRSSLLMRMYRQWAATKRL